MSEQGKNSQDVMIGGSHNLIAISLNNTDSSSDPNDLALSTLRMTGYNISQIAFLVCKLHNLEKIVFSGHFIRNNTQTIDCMNEAVKYFSKEQSFQCKAYFIKHDGFVGCLGCLNLQF